MRAVRATDGGARSMRPPRGADGAAGRTEPGAMRGRSRLERAAVQYTAGAGGAAVGPALAWGGAGPSRARNGAEAGGLRTALDGQRTAVAAPRGGGGQNSSRIELRPDGRYDNGSVSGRSGRTL